MRRVDRALSDRVDPINGGTGQIELWNPQRYIERVIGVQEIRYTQSALRGLVILRFVAGFNSWWV